MFVTQQAWFWIFFEMALFRLTHRTLFTGHSRRCSQAWATWPPKGVETVSPWHLPLVNTLTLLLSGTTVTWAHHSPAGRRPQERQSRA